MKKINILIVLLVGFSLSIISCQDKNPSQNDLQRGDDTVLSDSDAILEEKFEEATTNIQDNVEVVIEKINYKKEALEKQFSTANTQDQELIQKRLDFIKANMDTIQARGYYPNPNLSDVDKSEFQRLLDELAREIRDL